MSKGFASNCRLVLLASGLLVCFGGLGTRLVWLHVINRDEYLRSIGKARHEVIVEKARRGDILDARGAILATSRSLIVLGVDPSSLVETKKEKAKWPKLAALIGVPLPELEKIFTTKFREPVPANPAAAASPVTGSAGLVFNLTPPAAVVTAPVKPALQVWIDDPDGDPAAVEKGRVKIEWAKLKEGISESLYAEIEQLGVRGVYGQRDYRRVYPHNQLASHVIGFVNFKQQPATGIERYADFYLRGQDGWREGERDGRRRELAQFRTRDVPRADGYQVTLTIDANVQDMVEQELATIAAKYQPLKATIIVSDPRTGFILGLGNYPTFDPNTYNQIPKEEQGRMRNIALTDIYDPGSVFKIVAATAALQEGAVRPGETFDCNLASIDYRGKSRSLPDDDHHFDHRLTVAEIIAHSSNRGAAQLAMRVGEEKFYAYARAFGFGQRTGLPGGHEEPGILNPPSKWDGLTITRMPMGQSVSATVLQMHQAMSVVAAGGAFLQPQVIQRVRDESGETVYRYGPVVARRVMSTETARTLARMLMGVATTEGTAPEAAIAGFEVAGKTGTSQKLEEITLADGTKKKFYSKTHHVASFVGFFPASNPQVVISVVVDDADAHALNGVAYGAKVAAPSFKRLGEQLISYSHLDLKAGRLTAPSLLATLEGGRR